MEMKHLTFKFNLLFLFSFLVYTNANQPDCIYNIYVQTGSLPLAGTDANVSIFLSDQFNYELPITNLRNWGLTSSAASYFRRGGLDLFAGSGPCLRGPICSLAIVVNDYDDWFCDFIEVTTVGHEKACLRKSFTVKEWLGVNEGSAAILKNECLTPERRYGAAASE